MLNKNDERWLNRFARRKPTTEELILGIEKGDIVLVSQAITLVESQLAAHQVQAREIINYCLAQPRRALRIGITGTPGVGKSTFIEAFGQVILAAGHKIAILAIDPSSQLTRGSILGDKTRMNQLAADERVFIRPSPTGNSLGGVARTSRETIAVCEAAGFGVVLVETVGVGQSETVVRSMVDFFLLLLLPNAGDELQGIKRGIMEMADLIFINKAEGEAAVKAKIAKSQCNNALHLFPPKASGWTAKAMTGSALLPLGIDEVWQTVGEFYDLVKANNYLQKLQAEQNLFWFERAVQDELLRLFSSQTAVNTALAQARASVEEGKISPFTAAADLVKLFLSQIKS